MDFLTNLGNIQSFNYAIMHVIADITHTVTREDCLATTTIG